MHLRKFLQNGGRLLSPAGCGKEGIRILSPVPHPMQDVICLGLNYTEHAEEAFGYDGVFTAEKAYPIFFSKRVSEAPGSGDPIPAHRDLTERLDYENELGVILGRDARDVAEEDAAKYIFGYTIVNDVSARDLQTRHKQWYFGKSLDGFTPIGPCIVTADPGDDPEGRHHHRHRHAEGCGHGDGGPALPEGRRRGGLQY